MRRWFSFSSLLTPPRVRLEKPKLLRFVAHAPDPGVNVTRARYFRRALAVRGAHLLRRSSRSFEVACRAVSLLRREAGLSAFCPAWRTLVGRFARTLVGYGPTGSSDRQSEPGLGFGEWVQLSVPAVAPPLARGIGGATAYLSAYRGGARLCTISATGASGVFKQCHHGPGWRIVGASGIAVRI
jgi:hypothetical protein